MCLALPPLQNYVPKYMYMIYYEIMYIHKCIIFSIWMNIYIILILWKSSASSWILIINSNILNILTSKWVTRFSFKRRRHPKKWPLPFTPSHPHNRLFRHTGSMVPVCFSFFLGCVFIWCSDWLIDWLIDGLVLLKVNFSIQ